MSRTNQNETGFTLVEVLIIAPILILTIGTLMNFLFNQYGQLTQQGALINLQTEVQNITFSMQDDIYFAAGFNTTMNDNLEDSHEPSGGWQHNTTPETLIISTPALTANYRAENRQPVFINSIGCDPSTVEENAILLNNVIYFVQGTTLYKRIISAPSSMSTCGTSFVKQSCPAGSTSSTCPPDRILTTSLNTINFTYYDNTNNEVSDPTLASKVKIDIELKERAYAEDIFASSSITLKRLN